MLYISPDHRENLIHLERMLKDQNIDLDKAEAFLKRAVHYDKERLTVTSSLMERGDQADQESELCHGHLLFSLLRAYNRSH